jgi:DNA-binding Lrp family transcriptional regulator
MNNEKMKLKNTEIRLISELMKNSRRSDRELARCIHVSQPTITRTRQKLQNEGYFKEYTLIPRFSKLGYTLLAVTFVKFRESLTVDQADREKEVIRECLKKNHKEILMFEKGMGLGYDGIVISIHRDYSSFLDLKKQLATFETLKISNGESFIVNLKDTIRYRPLTLSNLAEHMLTIHEKVLS